MLRSAGRKVIYDAEHFFDAYRADSEYALRTILAARDAGAAVLCLCDTNGGTMPECVAEAVEIVKKRAGGGGATIGIHTHNDSAVAVANALAAICAGADHAQVADVLLVATVDSPTGVGNRRECDAAGQSGSDNATQEEPAAPPERESAYESESHRPAFLSW